MFLIVIRFTFVQIDSTITKNLYFVLFTQIKHFYKDIICVFMNTLGNFIYEGIVINAKNAVIVAMIMVVTIVCHGY